MSRSQIVLTSVLTSLFTMVTLSVGFFAAPGLWRSPVEAQVTQTQNGTVVRQVTVNGNGEITAAPDTAYIQIGVESSERTAQDALKQNSAQATAMIAKIKALGIAEKDIQTSNFSIYPQYDKDGHVIIGYTVNNQVSVTIHDLGQAGKLLDQVVQVGANRIQGISFGFADPSGLITQARDRATADALAKAQQLAKGTNATIGRVLVITENVGSQPPVMLMERAAPMAAADSVPVQAGEQKTSVQVQVTFELK